MADLKKLLTEYPDQAKTFVDEYGRKVDENGNPIESSSIDPEMPFLSTALSAPMLGSYTEASDKLDRMRSVMDRYNRIKESSMASKSFLDMISENPKLKEKVELAASKNPGFAKILKNNPPRLSDPAHTKEFLSAVERMSDTPLMKRLKEAKTFLGKGVESASEMISPFTSGISKVVEPVASVAGKAADVVGKIPYVGGATKLATRGAAPLLETGLAASDFSKGKYVSAAGHGLSALGAGAMMIPHPYAKMAGAGLLGIGTGIGLSADDEPESQTQVEDDADKAKQLRKANDESNIILNDLKNQYEDDAEVAPSPVPASEFADEKMPELPVEEVPSPIPSPTPSPTPSPMPSPTPSPTPAPSIQLSGARKPSSISDKLMDVIGMPSAYAEDTAPIAASTAPSPEPSPVPSPTPSPAAKKKPKDKAYYKNYAVAMANKSGVYPPLFLSIIPVEGGWNMDTKLENPERGKTPGSGNAIGPTQIMPGTIADFANRAAKQKYETPEIQAHVQGLVDKLNSKINFGPYQNALNEIRELKRKKIEPTKEQLARLESLADNVKARMKEFKPEDHLAFSAAIIKLKSLDNGLDAMNPEKLTGSIKPGTRRFETHGERNRRSYTGLPTNEKDLKKSYQYLDDTEPYYQKEKELYERYNKIEPELNEKGQPTGRKLRVRSDIAVPYGSGLEVDSEESPENKQEALAEKSKAPAVSKAPVTMQDIDSTPLTPEEQGSLDKDGYPSDIIDILKQSKEEDKDRRLRDLMVLRNYLQSGTTAQIGKGLQLMASGIVGAGPNKPFVTVPKLEGMETWDTLAKEGEKGVAASELMSKFAERSPSSLKSKRMQNTFISAMKRWYPEKELSKQDIDVIKSMSADEVEKQMEMEKGFAKQESSLFGKTLDRKFKVQKQAQSRTKSALDPIIQRLQGAKTLDTTIKEVYDGDIVDASNIARQISTDLGALLLPPGVKLGVTQQEEAQIKTFETMINKWRNYFNSDEIVGVLPSAYMPQLVKELKLFKDRYKDLLQRTGNGLKKEFYGLPEEYHEISDQAIQARVDPEVTQSYFVDSILQPSKPVKMTEEQIKRYEELMAKKEGRYEEWKAKQEGR
jgi:hypothetical protein